MVISIPVTVENRPFALELIRDVTESFLVADARNTDNTEITAMIADFNMLATRDIFSGLYNKNFINNSIDDLLTGLEEHPVASPDALPLLIEFDVDDFKKVNDTYGHSVGDDVLLYIAKHVGGYTDKHNGWTGRLGGDEFIICIPHSSSSDTRKACTAILAEISEYAFETDQGSFSITMSTGITRMHHGDSRRGALDRVDRLMYQAKQMPDRLAEKL